ncbi:MAG: SDR family NAD(P)-dependent oxidoreductase [Deltaproteobacteria bacterium]|nr:SDR family NAD(P)-dependent oxidoreductase [Deltaproteobacteria bacterium]
MRLENKVAIITGAGRGMGHAEAVRFAKEGAQVVVAEIDETSAKQTFEEIGRRGLL